MLRFVCLAVVIGRASTCLSLQPAAVTRVPAVKGAFKSRAQRRTNHCLRKPIVMIATGGEEPDLAESATRTTPASMQATDVTRSGFIDRAADNLDAFLDEQLLDPWSDPEECSIDTPVGCTPLLEQFKKLVREDYNTAEALWAGLFCSLGVSVGMQWVKAAIIAEQSMPPVSVVEALSPAADGYVISGYIYTPAAAAAAEFIQASLAISTTTF